MDCQHPARFREIKFKESGIIIACLECGEYTKGRYTVRHKFFGEKE